MKIEQRGNEWRVYPVDPNYSAHIPGMRQYGATAVGHRDAVAVLAHRMGKAIDTKLLESDLPVATLPMQKLRDYQVHGVNVLSQRLRAEGAAILADDMGLGKTLQTIVTWQTLGKPGPLLIVCPASVRRTWVKELVKWAGIDPVLIESGKDAAKLTNQTPVAITSYQLASSKLPAAYAPQMLVFDEAHLLRGRGAQRSLKLFDLSRITSYRLALTGTPQWSRPRDWWMLLKVLYGYRFGTADDFDYAYCGASVNKWGGKENKGATRLDELQLRIQHVMLRRVKSEVAADLPPITRMTRSVDATKEAVKASQAFGVGALGLIDALNATLDGKLEATIDAMESAGKSLVFTWQRRHVHELAQLAEERGLQVEVITGEDSQAQREAAVERARVYGKSVIATIGSMSAGVDGLQHVADTCIFHALDYVPINMAQAEARLHRIGAVSPVTVVYMVMHGTVDEQVLHTVVEKLDQWQGVMGRDGLQGISTALYSQQDSAAALKDIMEAFNGDD